MNSLDEDKINQIKKLSARSKKGGQISLGTDNQSTDGLSMAIRTKEDADTFMAELKAIKKTAK